MEDFKEFEAEPTALDFRTLPFPDNHVVSGAHVDEAMPREANGAWRGGDPAALAMIGEGGGSVICIPPDMMGIEAKALWQRIKVRMLLGLPPATAAEWLIRAVLSELRSTKAGKKVKVNAVFAGVTLAIARTHGVPIPTHERGIARDVQTRYATLLKIRKMAEGLIKARSLDFKLPGWLKEEWS